MKRLSALLLACSGVVAGQSVSGRVIDGGTGEPLARIQVRLTGAQRATGTDENGTFSFSDLEKGPYTLQAAGVGYRPLTTKITVADAGNTFVELLLPPELLRQERIDVAAGPYGLEQDEAVGLAGAELRNLASVLTDDPLRAVQALPGVVSNDDFQAQFAVRGAEFRRTGVYLDGVVLRSPFHAVQGDPESASATIINGDTLGSLNLHAGPPPVHFGDRSAAALDVRHRDGNREDFRARVSASLSNAAALVEGPIGDGSRGS